MIGCGRISTATWQGKCGRIPRADTSRPARAQPSFRVFPPAAPSPLVGVLRHSSYALALAPTADHPPLDLHPCSARSTTDRPEHPGSRRTWCGHSGVPVLALILAHRVPCMGLPRLSSCRTGWADGRDWTHCGSYAVVRRASSYRGSGCGRVRSGVRHGRARRATWRPGGRRTRRASRSGTTTSSASTICVTISHGSGGDRAAGPAVRHRAAGRRGAPHLGCPAYGEPHLSDGWLVPSSGLVCGGLGKAAPCGLFARGSFFAGMASECAMGEWAEVVDHVGQRS